MQIVWQRKSLVILGLVIGLVLGSLFYAQRTPVYQSHAQVLIVKRSPATPASANTVSAQMMFVEDYMSTQSVLLKSQVIASRTAHSDKVRRKLENEGLKSFPDAKKPEDLVIGIIKGLNVTRDNKETTGTTAGNNVMLLTFRCTDREDSRLILETLIDEYQKYIDEVYFDISKSMLDQIDRARLDLERQIEASEKRYEEFLKTAPILVTRGIGGGISAQHKEVASYSETVAKLKSELAAKQHDYENLKRLRTEKGSAAVIQYIIASRGNPGMTLGDPELDRALNQLLIKEHQLLSTFGEKHPDVVQVRKQIEMLRNMYGKESKPPAKPGNSQSQEEKDLDLAEKYINGLEIDVNLTQGRLAMFEGLYRKAYDDLRANNQYENTEDKLRSERERARALHARVQQVVDETQMRKESGGFRANTITPPGYGIKISPDPYQVFIAASLLGIMLGVGLAYLAEVSDKSFRNPDEIRKRLGLPVIGHIPALAPDEKAQQLVASGSNTIDPMLITHYQSNSVGAEAYRGVRTALYFSTQGEAHRVIQVTSPNVSDGKSTLAANLAASIAQSGKRTLLVDCDFRKPRVHKIFNVPSTLGMASAMAGQADLHSAIQQTAVPNLSVLPCGPRPANPAELLTSPKFSEIIEQLRQMFDFVVVDTPPILVVTDPAVVAPRVDGVVLCIRVTKNGRPYAERAREVLQSLGANVLGVVVNGFGTQVGGNKYGYEHYNYGYGEGYSYTYGYTYGYADKEAASYYGGQPDEVSPSGQKS
jgi:capsular exopolysaccharide synthesis family protein